MTQSIPNGFSSDELERMLASAMPEASPEEADDDDTLQREVIRIAEDIHDQMDNMSKAGDVPPQLVGKVVMLMTLSRMVQWHTHVGEMHIEDQPASAASWLKDAGKFQAIVNILSSIMVSDHDFTVRTDD